MHPLQPHTSFHIFNHANGFENVFRKEENFYFFLEKYRLYISPIAETYAYCLMPNHFHVVVRISKRAVIEELIRNKRSSNNRNNFSKVSNLKQSVNIIPAASNQSKSANFGKVLSTNIIPTGSDQSKSANFGKVEKSKISDSEIE